MKMINKMLHESAGELFIIQINFLDHNLALLSYHQYDQHPQNVKKLPFFQPSQCLLFDSFQIIAIKTGLLVKHHERGRNRACL